MTKIDLTLICEEFNLVDHLHSNRKFINISDVNDYIWEIYGERIKKHIMENVITGILLDRKYRLPLRFDYIDKQNGMHVSISFSEYLADIAEKTDIVFWHPDIEVA